VGAAPFPLRNYTGLINGKWVGADSGETFGVVNPGDGQEFCRVPNMGKAETEAAVEAAAAAFPAWAAKPAAERCAALRKLHDLMQSNLEGLAVLLTLESGKPFEEAKGEILYSASFLEWFSEEGKRAYGDVIPAPRADRRILTVKQPLGVAALLTPWNFSSAMVTRKLAPALAAGCTVVVRPSANTPLSALAVAQLAEQAGIPAGVINVVVGHDHDAIAGTLCRHPAVKKVSFTGSTRVGKLLMKESAESLKKLSFELGGNAPFVVFEDADLDVAAEACMMSKFRNAGQTCVCANRIYVHAAVYDAFKAKLVERVQALRLGNGMVQGVTVGPMISAAAVDKTEAFVKDAVAKGARVLTGGKRPAGQQGGFFFEPTVLENAEAGMLVVEEEIFGPVAPLVRFTDEKKALAEANAAEVGLAGYFFTK
jgi:succinate-semialdehyde dehydrogenase/glutarate-semialdehyde dehydrogenase